MLDRPSVSRSVVVRGPCPADEVWDRYVRPRRWSQWSPQIRSVDCPDETIRPGSTGVVHGPFGLRAGFRVLDVDPAGPVRGWSWAASVAGVRLVLRHTVEAIPSGTATGLTVRGFAPAVLAYLPVARLALGRLVS